MQPLNPPKRVPAHSQLGLVLAMLYVERLSVAAEKKVLETLHKIFILLWKHGSRVEFALDCLLQ